MPTLLTLLKSLRHRPRPLSDDEKFYLRQLRLELVQAPCDAGRWKILEREGLGNVQGLDLDAQLLTELQRLRHSALN